MDLSYLALSAGATLLAYGAWRVALLIIRPLRSPLRQLPGPPSSSWIWGNFKEIFNSDPAVQQEAWVDQYGLTLSYNGIMNVPRFYTLDPRALNHILTQTQIYQKPSQVQRGLGRILGKGVLITEGEEHRKQRRIMNPAFGPVQVRELTPIFVGKSNELRDYWAAQVDRAVDGVARIDVCKGLSRATLDIIGLAGFNYHFDSLNPEDRPNELNQAFSTVFGQGMSISIWGLLMNFIPILRLIPNKRERNIDYAQRTMDRIGLQLVAEKKAAVLASKQGKDVDSQTVQDRDLLSLLVRANMATDLPESQKLSDKDVLAQIPTFMVAGHETTSTGTTWALHGLTQRPDIQQRLRAEMLSMETDSPSMDQLQALPLLDAVVRETMRFYAPVPQSIRDAVKDDVIPLAVPYTDAKGVEHHSVRIAKGDPVFIPILALNRNKSIWGEDAHEFKPERWENGVPKAASNIPGVWGNMMSFLGGPRACIGYRFSLVEMKALLFALVRQFEFELAVPADQIQRKSTIVTRPVVKGQEGNQLPLLVRRYVPPA